MTLAPYYSDDRCSLYLGDSLEIAEWLAADVLVTDPPFGRGWKQGANMPSHGRSARSAGHSGIANDKDTSVRDAVLEIWGDRPSVVFGDLMLAPAPGTKQVAVCRMPPDAGSRGAVGGFRRDLIAIYLRGRWPTGIGGRSSVIATAARIQGSDHGLAARSGHPHAKPVDVLEVLIAACPPGVIADPFAGSGSTLIAARNQGRRSIGVELDERFCERAARRLSQGDLFDLEAM